MGLGEYDTIASINGSGTGDLLDALVEALPEKEKVFKKLLGKYKNESWYDAIAKLLPQMEV